MLVFDVAQTAAGPVETLHATGRRAVPLLSLAFNPRNGVFVAVSDEAGATHVWRLPRELAAAGKRATEALEVLAEADDGDDDD